MDPRERWSDPQAALRLALEGWQAQLWTALPGVVAAVDLAKMTVSVQPTVQAVVQGQNGALTAVRMPLLVDCPLVFPNGGGFMLTFPVAVGDECLVVFAARCIDAWWQSGGVQPQAELRMHDLSDGFAIPGPRSQPRVVPGISSANVQLRNEEGAAFVEIAPDGTITLKSPTMVVVDAPELHVTGDVTVEGEVTADGEGTFNGGHTVSQHVHGGVQSGGSNTGTPTG